MEKEMIEWVDATKDRKTQVAQVPNGVLVKYDKNYSYGRVPVTIVLIPGAKIVNGELYHA